MPVRRLYEYDGPHGHWLVTPSNAPPGALYDAAWYRHHGFKGYTGADGISLVAITPSGYPWTVDGPASNCTLPNDDRHKCWQRTGDPKHPTGPDPLTVGKVGGPTCGAGAGSIAVPGYHGFLQGGRFTAG